MDCPAATAVQLASYSTPCPPAASLTAKPVTDDPLYRLPSLKLASDGPVQRLFAPTNEGPWSPDQAVLPWAEFHDNQVTVHNIRNSYYRTVDDYTVRLYNKTFDLRKLTSVDFIVVPFNDNPSIAHAMLSFGFEDKDYLVSSVEIRKRAGQSYSAVTGFFNQYTLMYVLADERDVHVEGDDRLPAGGVRLSHEGHAQAGPGDVRRRDAAGEQAGPRAGVLQHAHQQLHHERPHHVNHLIPDGVPYDYRVLLPGHSDELAYDLGLIEAKGSFEETRAAAKVNFKAYLYRDDPDFSRKIREK